MSTALRSCRNIVFTCSAVVLLSLAIPAQGQSIDKVPKGAPETVKSDVSFTPIEIGPREEVGKESLGSKAARKAVGGVIGGLLGSGSRGGSAPKGPRTRRDPTRRLDYVESEKREPEITVGARTRWTDDGLLVSTRISDHEEKGTYHSVYLQSCDGRRLYPRRIEVYDLWAEHSLSVSWTRTAYVDGQVVNRESGGWSDSWSEFLGRHSVDEAELPGIWQMYGYDRAHSGIQQLGAYFNLDPEQLAESGDLALIAHVTRPEQDPVITEPFDWVISGENPEQPTIVAPEPVQPGAEGVEADALRAATAWSEQCTRQTSPPAAATVADRQPPVRRGYPIPTGLSISAEPTSTGDTTGIIAYLQVRNGSDERIEFPQQPALISASDEHQGYIVPGGRGTSIPPGATRRVPVKGYCSDVRKPPVPADEALPPLEEWIVPTGAKPPIEAPPHTGTTPPGRALVPGTDMPVPRTIDPAAEPEIAAPYLLDAAERIRRATSELQQEGKLETPFSGDPGREREAVVQQVIWRYAAELAGRPYYQEEFTERLEAQYEEQTGKSVGSVPDEDRERLKKGSDDFWESFELVGERAKVLEKEDEPAVGAPEPEPVPSEEQAMACEIERTMDHTDADSEFLMSESYKDEVKRDNLAEWFAELPEVADLPEGGTFEATQYPASVWAVAGREFIGGYGNAVAKHIYQEAGGGSDWVWSTELLEVDAESNGVHTLSVSAPEGETCDTLVVGAGGGVVEAWSNTIDPIADTRDIVDALRVTRDVAIIVASATLAPATAGASIAVGIGTLAATQAFDAEFGSDADAAVAVEGRVHIQVKRRRLSLDAHSRSALSGDGDIESDGTRVIAGETSDQDPRTITVTTQGNAAVKARADGNGVAEGTLESQVGLGIVAFCVCGESVQFDFLTDAGLFLASEQGAGAATVASQQLEEMLNETIEPYMQMSPEEVIPTAREDLPTAMEAMIREWYLTNGSDPGKVGYFEITSDQIEGG